MDAFYLKHGNKKVKVRGKWYSQTLGVHLELGKGWRVTHMPTGCAIPPLTGFDLESTALEFCEVVEAALGDLLNNPNQADLEQIIREDNPVFVQFCYALEQLGRPATVQDLQNMAEVCYARITKRTR